ncbi:hypothetical protein PV328_006852 [Microctonus aethiopoides]|uniref:Gamma-tubulin complex component 6 n=1 Tax=Microctonus aethiopoides TaxID=144406 RepID=A0AA39KTZ8_9HYME|nr:hypothetical protein PV328_006852 [Microctonus aethiopoides]
MDMKIETLDFFGLVTELCKSLMGKCRNEHSTSNNKQLINDMRKTAFEILLNKHKKSYNINDNQQIEASDPVAELLKYCFVLKTTFKSFSSASKLEKALDSLIDDDGNYDPSVKSVLYFLYCLRSYQPPENNNMELFNIGGMRSALPETHQWHKEVPQYQIYSLSSLELPIELNKLLYNTSNYEFNTVNSQIPFSGLFQLPFELMNNESPIRQDFTSCDLTFRSSMNSICDKIHGSSSIQSPRNQREIEFQNVDSNESSPISMEDDILFVGISDFASETESRTWETLGSTEISKQSSFVMDSTIAQGYFENFKNLPVYSSEINKCRNKQYNIITMDKFIENSKLALLGIDSNCYVWNDTLGFVFDSNIIVSGLSRESLQNIRSDITHWATCFKLLTLLVHPNPESGELRQDGLIFKAMCNSIEDILIHYQAVILQVFNHNYSSGLLNLFDRVRDVGFLISEVARLCRCDHMLQTTLGEGTGILSHIYNQVTKITKPKIALVYYSVLKSCCEVYFQLLEKWIFEGTCDETYGEFMIKIRGQYLRNRGHKFWTRCFGINNEAVPGFLKNLTNSILQCGKAVKLLKICDSKNPICNLFATKRPTVKVCLNMNMLSEQEKICSNYMIEGVRILGPNVTLVSAFREMRAIEKEKADYVIAAQHDTLQRIKEDQEAAKLELVRFKRELFADQKKQCEDAVLRREKIKETILMEDKLWIEQQLIEDERIKKKQLDDVKVTLDYYKDLAKEAKKRRVRAAWRVQRMALFDERVHAIAIAHLDDASPVINVQSNVPLTNLILEDVCTEENRIKINNINSNEQRILIGDNTTNDENCNISDQEITHRQTMRTDEINRANRPTKLDFKRKDAGIFENKTMENVSVTAMSLGTEAILNEIKESNNHSLQKPCIQVFHNVITQDTNLITGNEISNAITSNDNNCNFIILEEKNNELEVLDNINQTKASNDATINLNEGPQFPQIPGNELNDVTPMSCTTDSYVPSAIGSSVLYNYTEAGSSGDTKNDFETPTTPGDCLDANEMKREFPMENIFSRSSTQYFNPFSLDDRSPVIFESSLTKADVEIIDNTSLQVYLEKSVLIPLRVQSQLANSAIVKYLLYDHQLLLHFQSLRSFFFLLNGEFARNLTGPLYSKFYEISLPVELFNSHTLTNLLKNALHCSLNNSYKNSELLSLTAFESPSLLKILDPQALNCLCLHYKVSWPLNIIIDEALMQQYSKVFKFLLMVGRVLWVLQEDFSILKNERKASRSYQYHRVQLFRHAMMQFMTALHNYITCSVLHASWTEFEKELENATTLDQIYTTHVSYIKKILSRCMLTNRGEKLRICLCNTFEIILKFHNCLRSYEWIANSTGYIHPNYKKLEQMYDAFCTLRTYPAQVVDRSASSGYEMHLSRFVDALNINSLFNL